jgi:hypothetical protein
MAKYYSTAAYRAADALNKQLKNIYNEWGGDSEIYEMYVNRLTADLPAGTVHVSKGGFIQVTKAKGALSAAQVKKATRGLPDKAQAMTKYKRQVAEERLSAAGNEVPTESQIQREAKGVTRVDVKQYVDDKSFVQSKEDARGKLIYSDSVADLMRTAGAKSYKLLRAILEEGEVRDAKTSEEDTNTAAVEGGYQAGKADINS